LRALEAELLLLPYCAGPRWPRTLRGWRVARVRVQRGSLGALVDALGRHAVAFYSDGREGLVGTLADRRVGPWMDTLRAFAAHHGAELQLLPALDLQGPRSAPFEDIVLDAHLAFGSGLHPTTRLCADVMREIDVPRSALDVGCGSGILSLLAARCRASVVAVDVDPYARAVARHNLRANGLRARVMAALPRRCFPLIIANLWPDALVQLADDMKRRLAPGGLLLAAGAHDDDMAAMIPRLCPLRPLRVVSRDGWAALLLQAP
jgi:SAM-dependent methyltransferase